MAKMLGIMNVSSDSPIDVYSSAKTSSLYRPPKKISRSSPFLPFNLHRSTSARIPSFFLSKEKGLQGVYKRTRLRGRTAVRERDGRSYVAETPP